MAEHMSDDGIGKGRPPKQTRFPKGKSGNPKGRPKGRRNIATIVERVAHERQGEHTTKDLVLKRLQQRAANGDLGAKTMLDKIRDRYQPEDPKPRLRGIFVPPVLSMEEFKKVAEAQRLRMLWHQQHREEIWEKMGLIGESSVEKSQSENES